MRNRNLARKSVFWPIKQPVKRSLFIGLVGCLLALFLFLSGSAQSCYIVGDLNGDCRVDIQDLIEMASEWMGPSPCRSEEGLILHWKLNESSGTAVTNSSGVDNSGSVVGCSWNPEGGYLAGALEFDGTNDYVWSSYKGILGSNPRSCTAWIKADRTSGEIMSWGDRDIPSGRWVIWLNDTGVLRVDTGGGHVIGSRFLADDRWHHIAVISDGSNTDQITLYVDGKIEAVTEVVPQPIDTAGRATTKIGVFQMPYLQGSYFSGLIDDVRIYSRTLNMQEVWSLAEAAAINYACADMNADETVNLEDLTKLSQNWASKTPSVIINEFMADNDSQSPLEVGEILDGNGDSSDWIEIYNPSGMTIDIGGCFLTDDAELKTKWQFPLNTVLKPRDYLIVFASGKISDENPVNYPYVDSVGYLHTNFNLSKQGEYLALIDADGITPLHEYNQFHLGDATSGYPIQESDISYGCYYHETRYFSIPTPGADNITSPFEAFVEKPDVSIKGGCYQAAVEVTMSCGTQNAFIRYTTDGTVPSLTNGSVYSEPIHINNLTTIFAKAFKPGMQPSDTRIETYLFVDPSMSPSNTNLPIVVVDTLGQSIPDQKDASPVLQYSDCRLVIVDVDDLTGRAEITGPEHFEGIGRIKRRGESTYGQGHYGFEVVDEYGEDKDASLLGMPPESDWILSYDVLDYTMMKNEIAFKWFRDMGHYAPRQRYVELYLNTDGGVINSSDYKGLYILREKIKRDKNRVNIARLDASHNLEPKVSGGYIFKCDKPDPGDIILNEQDLWEAAYYNIGSGAGTGILSDPDSTVITDAQINWAVRYLNEVHSVFWQNTSSTYYPGFDADYTDYIDVNSWIDHGFVEQIGNDSDAFWGSYYVYKDRNGKVVSGPPWDYDRSFHNNGGSYDKPYDIWRTQGEIFGKWHQKLQENLEYRMALADRWFEHRETALNTARTMAYIDHTAALISEARSRPKKTYPKPFEEEIALFKEWITNRLDWLDIEIARRFADKPPILNPSGGDVNPNEPLRLSKPAGAAGDIYFTLNGEDPRLEGGAVNPNARMYDESGQSATESIALVAEDAHKAVWVPSMDIGDSWTGGTEPYDDTAWTHGTPVTGITAGGVGYEAGNGSYPDYITYDVESSMYNLRQTCYIRIPFTADAGDIANAVSMTLRVRYDDGFRAYLNGIEIASANAPTSPDWDQGASEQHSDSTAVMLIDFDCSAFVRNLQTGDNILAIRGFNRGDGSSDFLVSAELIMDMISISEDSPIVLDKSMIVTGRILDGSNWSAKKSETYAVGPIIQHLRISEIMYHPADPNTEFIELQNIGTEAMNLNLVQFTDGINFTFDDRILAPGGYMLIVENQKDFESKYGTGLPIAGEYEGALANEGEKIVLRDAIGRVIHDFDYKDSWYELTDGFGYSLTMANPTSADPNLWSAKSGWRASLYIGGTPGQSPEAVLEADSIVINELLAHSHGTDPDWIELYNTTNQNIHIGGWFLTDDNSDLSLMRKYEIPDHTVISAKDYLVFVGNTSFNAATPAEDNIPFGLSEGGETLYLYSGQNGEMTGLYQTQQTFDASETGIPFGRYEKAELSGGYDFVRQIMPSQGAANHGPLVPEIVITEIYYNPPEGTDYEYVELYNSSAFSVKLETTATTEIAPDVFITEEIPWRLEGVDYQFPPGVTMPPGSRILVAKTPATYDSVPCAVFGPYDGKLDNGGEEIEIQIPGDQEYADMRYWIPIEKIDYKDNAPWPINADGGGDSLHRRDVMMYARDYTNWESARPSPGY